MSNEEKLNSLITLQAELQTKLEKLTNEVSKLKEEYDNLPEGKKKEGKEKKYSEKLSEKVLTKQELSKVNAEIKELKSEMKGKKTKKIVAKEKGNNRTKIGATIGIVALAAALVVLARGTRKNNNNNTASIFGITNCSSTKETPKANTIVNKNGEELELITEKPRVSLADITNEKDVKNAVDGIYNELASMLGNENDAVLNFVANHENIEDMIRVLNGELPINSKFDETTLNKMIQMHADIFANRGHIDNTLYDVRYENFFEDNSLEAMYAKSYDELYAKIAKARRNNNVGEFIEQVGVLGSKLYNEWYLAGLNGGFNPYAFDENKQYFALLAATSRYNNFVLEYAQQNDLVICIPTCYNLETKEYVDREINEIMYGLYYGENEFGEVICTRGNNEKFIPFAYAYNNLNNILLEKSETQVKALK